MAFVGGFDSELRQESWWDSELSPVAWFDAELIEVSTSGSQTYDETISVAVSVASEHTVIGAFNSATSAVFTLGYSPTPHAVIGYTTTAPVSVGEVIGGSTTSSSSVSAELSLGDTLASGLAYSDTVAASVSVAGSVVSGLAYRDTVAASVSVAGTFTTAQVFSSALAEGVSLAEAYVNTGGFNSALVAQLTLADQLIGGMSYTDILTAQVTLSDGAVVSTIIAKTLGEAIAVVESLGATHIQVSSLGETLLLNATVEGVRAGLTWPAPSEVLLGVQYGPTGADFTGTAAIVVGEGYVFASQFSIQIETPQLFAIQRPKIEARSEYMPALTRVSGDAEKSISVFTRKASLFVRTARDELFIRQSKTLSIAVRTFDTENIAVRDCAVVEMEC